MAIADLANVPSTPAELAVWAFANMAHHRDVNAVILRENKVDLPEYVLDPVDTSENSAWMDQHQEMHNNTDAILGIPGFDISDVDWKSPDQLASWVWLHYTLHYQEAQASGVW